jgi:hypothetical protein
MESKSKSPVHLCQIIDTCCLNKISRAVLSEILKFVIFFILFSVLLELGELIIMTFYRSFCGQEVDPNSNNPVPVVVNDVKSKTKSLFGETLNLNPQNYDFNFA